MDEIDITDIYSGNIQKNRDDASLDRQRREKETGFPSPARDHLENTLSLDEYIIRKPAATFFVRVKGDGMNEAGIYSNDILVVDRSLKPEPGSIVIVLLDGEYKVRQLVKQKGEFHLVTNSSDDPVKISDDLEYSIWGVVSFAIHQYV